ncbi:hypothetical protein QYE76_058086 [Lolium multiflorum]|uniref:DDE Tnp4 domain-containing protein n=1 Tax=Lolium multiflorum TaxID=4521 RepID=A0AAD8T4J5_LOLMU|nr:hypothetical protein QYE76_058086 [Lolium multiflorum]
MADIENPSPIVEAAAAEPSRHPLRAWYERFLVYDGNPRNGADAEVARVEPVQRSRRICLCFLGVITLLVLAISVILLVIDDQRWMARPLRVAANVLGIIAHDASILADSLSRPDGLQIRDGKFYLGDAGYACRPGILNPFRKTRYHLNEFSAKHRPQNVKELFNLRHSSLRVTIEREFAALKNKFKVLDQKPFHTFDTQVKLVLACFILHNWILDWGEDEFFEEVVSFDELETGHGVEAGNNVHGMRRGKSGQMQCGKPEATPPSEKQ